MKAISDMLGELPYADLVVQNAIIYTSDPKVPWAEAMAVRGGRIVGVGNLSSVQEFIGRGTRLLDLEEKMVVPGFIDSHVHFISGGLQMGQVDLRKVKSKQEFVMKIERAASTAERGNWILGGGWNDDNWGGELPEASWIDNVSEHNPVWLVRMDGHMGLANTVALRRAKIDTTLDNIAGGAILKTAQGAPTGLLVDAAMQLLLPQIPEPTIQERRDAMLRASKLALSRGVTGVVDFGRNFPGMSKSKVWEDFSDVYKWADKTGHMLLRVWMFFPMETWSQVADLLKESGRVLSQWLYIGGVKSFADGSLGSNSALFFEVVTDNGSAYKAAGRLIMSHFPQIYWTPCAAHCIDLLLEDFAKMPWIKKVIRRAKYITKFVYAHPHLHHLFCQCSKGKEIIRPSTTRFATNYILLDSLQDAKDALMDTFVSNAWKNDDRFASLRRTPEAHNSLAIIFDCVEKPGKFWFEVMNVIEVTEPLVKVLRKVDGERPSIAFVYEAMFRAREAIRSYLRAHNLVDRFSIISTKFYERWNGQLHNDLHAAAHILNPRYGFGKSFDNNDDDVQLKIGLENVLDKLVSDPIERVQVAKDLDMYRKKIGLSFRRPVAENAKSCLNPEDWWTNYGVETKALKDVAIRIVSQPCSASGCERNWSIFEHIHAKKRNRLTTERLNDLVFVHYNLRFDLKELASTTHENMDLDDIHPSLPTSEWIGEEFSDDDHDDMPSNVQPQPTDHASFGHTDMVLRDRPSTSRAHGSDNDVSDDDRDSDFDGLRHAQDPSSDSESDEQDNDSILGEFGGDDIPEVDEDNEPLFSMEELATPPPSSTIARPSSAQHVYCPRRRKLKVHKRSEGGPSGSNAPTS